MAAAGVAASAPVAAMSQVVSTKGAHANGDGRHRKSATLRPVSRHGAGNVHGEAGQACAASIVSRRWHTPTTTLSARKAAYGASAGAAWTGSRSSSRAGTSKGSGLAQGFSRQNCLLGWKDYRQERAAPAKVEGRTSTCRQTSIVVGIALLLAAVVVIEIASICRYWEQ